MRGATLVHPYMEHSAKFQSTLPMRGATADSADFDNYLRISIHAPHAGSDLKKSIDKFKFLISIHAPHAGSDYLING